METKSVTDKANTKIAEVAGKVEKQTQKSGHRLHEQVDKASHTAQELTGKPDDNRRVP